MPAPHAVHGRVRGIAAAGLSGGRSYRADRLPADLVAAELPLCTTTPAQAARESLASPGNARAVASSNT